MFFLLIICFGRWTSYQKIDKKKQTKETKCRDPIFAILLYGNLAAIIAVAGVYGTSAFTEAVTDSTSGYNYNGYIYATFILGAVAIVLTGVSLPIMMCIPMILIKCSLISMLILSGVMMAMSFVYGNIWGGIFGVSIMLFSVSVITCAPNEIYLLLTCTT